jgi:hypothetical protein
MSTDLAERRKARALTLLLIAGATLGVAAVTSAIEYRSAHPEQASELVVPGLANTIAGAQRVSIASSEASYRIEKTQRGWAMRDRGDFPVQAARLEQLTRGLTDMRTSRRLTADASKHARLGVDDPRQGGRGVLVQIENAERAFVVDLIFGIEPGGRTFVRRTGQDQVWEVRADPSGRGLPPLRDIASWLNLRPLELPEDSLARVEIIPATGRGYVLARAAGDQPWRIVSPDLAAASQSLVTTTAQHLNELRPTDVLEAPAIQGAAKARLRAITFQGVAIEAELIESDGKTWLKLVARAQTPEQEAAALELNNRVAGWAYALSEMEASELAPALATLLPAAQ